jgi:hypothetical protein
MEAGGYPLDVSIGELYCRKWEKRIHAQDKRHIDTLATAQALQARRKIQDERERGIALWPITLERMDLFYA